MTIDDLRRVLIVGAGTMGQQIALQVVRHGYDVTLHDTDEATLAPAMQRIRGYAEHLAASGTLADPAAALARIRPTADLAEAGREADLVSESVPEDPFLKGRVFGDLNLVCPKRTVFTTNASVLVPSFFAEASGRPDRLLALHFHPDVWVSNVVDVMPHAGTAPEAIALVEAFARRIGQVPIVLKRERSGYVFNALLGVLIEVAQSLVAGEVAAAEDVDRAWMGITKMDRGPFGTMDHIGLDTVWQVVHLAAQRTGRKDLARNAAYLKEHFLDRGKLGVKSGEGFYTYPDPAFARAGFVEGETVRQGKPPHSI